MMPCPIEPTCGTQQVQGHWYEVPEVPPVERRDICPVKAVRCMGQVNCPPDTHPHINSEALLCSTWSGAVWVVKGPHVCIVHIEYPFT
ncbi:hypothetical protein TNCT_493491 [Trichonephila clavata]|uniref:Uncharacterized protein n=1 Tax=Trichonephila clavata TaxID=2740835 RepID=A0A8X6FSW5_TRICU|nr:hypothetical protein TNCT_493491 [Trichonephila clavata]